MLRQLVWRPGSENHWPRGSVGIRQVRRVGEKTSEQRERRVQTPQCEKDLRALVPQGSEFRDQWRRVMLEMNLTLMAILKLTPAEPPPGVACLRTTVPLTFGYVLLPPGAAGAVLALRSCEDLK